jgi:hypothetical protein
VKTDTIIVSSLGKHHKTLYFLPKRLTRCARDLPEGSFDIAGQVSSSRTIFSIPRPRRHHDPTEQDLCFMNMYSTNSEANENFIASLHT